MGAHQTKTFDASPRFSVRGQIVAMIEVKPTAEKDASDRIRMLSSRRGRRRQRGAGGGCAGGFPGLGARQIVWSATLLRIAHMGPGV